MRSVLIDTGPLIALFAVDDKDQEHFDQLVPSLSDEGLRLLISFL